MQVALEQKRDRRDAGMRVDAETRALPSGRVEVIQEYEGLDSLAGTGWAHQPSDWPVSATENAGDDAAVFEKRGVHAPNDRDGQSS
jgi:hypothetical protein